MHSVLFYSYASFEIILFGVIMKLQKKLPTLIPMASCLWFVYLSTKVALASATPKIFGC